MRRAFQDFLAAETAARPVLVVLEDLHWGDWPTARFVDSALVELADRPLLVLALARGNLKEQLPNLWAGRPVSEISLGQLSKRAGEHLVRAALDGVEPAVCARLVEQAGGNVLFLEELIRAVSEGKPDALPESVLAMMQARLDRLPAEARRVLRAASVFSNLFWARGVEALLGGSLEIGEWLQFLVEQEVIARRGDRKFASEEEYVFRHALVREAAYSLLTDADRRLGHQIAAGWLEQAGETEAVVLAEHHERGGEPERAAAWYLRAAEQALEGNDLAAALARADQGLACADEGGLHLVRAKALSWLGHFADEGASADRALEALEAGSAPWCEAASEAATARARLGDLAGLAAIGEALLVHATPQRPRAHVLAVASTAAHLLFCGQYALAHRLLDAIRPAIATYADADPAVAAAILRVLGVRSICAGDLGDSLEHKRASVAAYERAGDLPNGLLQRGNLGSIYINLGAYAEAEALLREAASAADRLGLASVAALCRANLGAALGHLGKVDEAIAVATRAVDEFGALSEVRMVALALADLSFVRSVGGDLVGAAGDAATAIELAADIAPSKAYALGHAARIALALGDPAAALAHAREAMAILESTGGLDEGEPMVRLVHAEALHATGAHDAARTAILAAYTRLLEVASKIADPRWRASFLENVRDNARTVALAEEWA
jgi:tetratricopeptide (TPR) repeat protein